MLKRIFLIPIGLFLKLMELAVDGSRDIYNKFRFKNVIIDSNCCIDSQTIIKPYAHILSSSIINKSTINSYSYIGRNCLVQNAIIGRFCSIANDVCIGLGTHPTDLFSTSTLFYRRINTFNIQLIKEDLLFDEYKTIEIGNDVWIGCRAIILDGVSIGNGAIVAANSVVTKDVPPYAIVGGSPAKVIKYRLPSEKMEEYSRLEWWNWDLNEIKNKLL